MRRVISRSKLSLLTLSILIALSSSISLSFFLRKVLVPACTSVSPSADIRSGCEVGGQLMMGQGREMREGG